MMINSHNLFRLAYTRPIMAGLAAGMVLLLADRALSASPQATAQAFEKEANTCVSAIKTQERANAIPTGLMEAISLAESGRWFDETPHGKGAVLAWPWTVTTGGKGHFLPSRTHAVSFVKSLQAKGVKNIDVGCMQINLKYHPNAFRSVNEAFDVHANTAYAASFLKKRFAVRKSWLEAAGDYHSTTPDLNEIYRTKISHLWQQVTTPSYMTASRDSQTTDTTGSDVDTDSDISRPSLSTPMASVTSKPDINLTQRFNQAFKVRRTSGGGIGTGSEIRNRANALKPLGSVAESRAPSRNETFAQRRQAQLAAWRLNHHTN